MKAYRRTGKTLNLNDHGNLPFKFCDQFKQVVCSLDEKKQLSKKKKKEATTSLILHESWDTEKLVLNMNVTCLHSSSVD